TANMLPRYLAVVAFACAVLACRADDDTRSGAAGEPCGGRDTDCRDGLLCDLGVCVVAGPAPTYSCDDICARLQECEATDAACPSDCRITTEHWSFRARDEFGICLVEELPCTEARARFAPQTCYSRITFPASRRERCDRFVESARQCGGRLDTLEV